MFPFPTRTVDYSKSSDTCSESAGEAENESWAFPGSAHTHTHNVFCFFSVMCRSLRRRVVGSLKEWMGGMFPRLYHVSTDSFSLLLGWAREQQLFVSWNWKHTAEQEKTGLDCAVTDSTGWKQTVEESSTTVVSGSAESFMEKESRAFFSLLRKLLALIVSLESFRSLNLFWSLLLVIYVRHKMLNKIFIWLLFIRWSSQLHEGHYTKTSMTRKW